MRPHTAVDQSLQFFITRLYHDVVTIMRELNVDKVEITCLKAIFLFDPGMFNRIRPIENSECKDALFRCERCRRYLSCCRATWKSVHVIGILLQTGSQRWCGPFCQTTSSHASNPWLVYQGYRKPLLCRRHSFGWLQHHSHDSKSSTLNILALTMDYCSAHQFFFFFVFFNSVCIDHVDWFV